MSNLQVKTVIVDPSYKAVVKPDTGYVGLSQVEAQSTWRNAWQCIGANEPSEFSSFDGNGIACLYLDTEFSNAFNIDGNEHPLCFEDWRIFRPLIELVKGVGRLAIMPRNGFYEYEDDSGTRWPVVYDDQMWILDGVWSANSAQGRDIFRYLSQPGLSYREALNVFRFVYRPRYFDYPGSTCTYAAYFASLPSDPASLWLLGVMRLDDHLVVLNSCEARDAFLDAEVTLTVNTMAY
jgi:hypothetical protein